MIGRNRARVGGDISNAEVHSSVVRLRDIEQTGNVNVYASSRLTEEDLRSFVAASRRAAEDHLYVSRTCGYHNNSALAS